jgi:nucleoside-diphosphate-sugar epimerase
MELPMFLRLLQRRPILVPHEGLVVGSYGHVDDLCDAMITIAGSAAAAGEVFNVSGESIDVNRYIAVLAAVVGVEPDVVYVPDDMLPELVAAGVPPAFGHLFKVRHHAMVSIAKLQQRLGVTPRFDLASGHRDTYEWFRAQAYDQLSEPLADPVWKATWDFEHEAAIAGRICSRA